MHQVIAPRLETPADIPPGADVIPRVPRAHKVVDIDFESGGTQVLGLAHDEMRRTAPGIARPLDRDHQNAPRPLRHATLRCSIRTAGGNWRSHPDVNVRVQRKSIAPALRSAPFPARVTRSRTVPTSHNSSIGLSRRS